jgi:hypothetical protein
MDNASKKVKDADGMSININVPKGWCVSIKITICPQNSLGNAF